MASIDTEAGAQARRTLAEVFAAEEAAEEPRPAFHLGRALKAACDEAVAAGRFSSREAIAAEVARRQGRDAATVASALRTAFTRTWARPSSELLAVLGLRVELVPLVPREGGR